MNQVTRIAQDNAVRQLQSRFENDITTLVDLAIAIQQIPAPTFEEAVRARFIQQKMGQIGLADVFQDELHNVYGRLPAPATGPPVIVSAHSDTVFPANTDLTVRREGEHVFGPGIGDNSMGVAGILFLAETLISRSLLSLPRPIWFVSNVGEEGLGDLRGMRAVVDHFGGEATYLVVEGGLFGQISHEAIGVRRYKIEVTTTGGHSWGSFGKRSAIHEIGRLIARIDQIAVPRTPKTTYNVGVIEGGTSINTIAQSAKMLLDLRSESPEALDNLVQEVQTIVERANGRLREKASVTMTEIGNRPAGSISREDPLVQVASEALAVAGWSHVNYITSSTDANIPLSRGIPAVCVGLTESNNAHRLDEYISLRYLPIGMHQLLLLTLAAAGYDVA